MQILKVVPEPNQLVRETDPMKARHIIPTFGKAVQPWVELDHQDTGVRGLEAPKVVVLDVVLVGSNGEGLVLGYLFMDSLSEHDGGVDVE